MTLLWRTGYDPPPDPWQGEEVPAPGRLQRVAAPGPATGRPASQVLRFELRPGDVWTDTDGYRANRCEVYGRAGQPWSTPGNQWPDPAGSERWYGFRLFVPADFATVTTADPWLVFTQWKGLRGGSPPIALEVKRSGLRLGGTRTNTGKIPGDGALGTIVKGAWTQLAVGLSLSPDPAVGWVEVWRDGAQALPRTAVATMDLVNGQPDPVYLKQGIYRDPAWTVPHVLYFGPTAVGTARTDVM
jgi:hypothetical protein